MRNDLELNPKKRTPLGSDFYKIRLGSKSKGSGKSGGFGIITYYIDRTKDSQELFLITIYDKSEDENIRKEDLEELLKKYL